MSAAQPPHGSPQQSPINLRNPVITDFGDNALEIHWAKDAKGHLTSGHDGVKITFGFDSRMYVRLDQHQFFLTQFHLHHPSEHAVDGAQQSVELHAVHQNLDDGRLAVVAIFIEPGNGRSKSPPLFSSLASIIGKGTSNEVRPVAVNPSDYLPADTKRYYRYEGSLTTPPFTENVSWAVLQKPRLISQADLTSLIDHVRHPARLPQPLNRRFILANFKP